MSPSPVTRLSHDLSFVNVTCAASATALTPDDTVSRNSKPLKPLRLLLRPPRVYILDYFSITGKCFRLDDCLLFFHHTATPHPYQFILPRPYSYQNTCLVLLFFQDYFPTLYYLNDVNFSVQRATAIPTSTGNTSINF